MKGLGMTWAALLISASVLIFISVLILFLSTMRSVARNERRFLFKDTSIVVGVYTVVCMCSVFTLSIPRAQPLCEAVSQVVFMIAAYSFYSLLVKNCSNCDGELRDVTENNEKASSPAYAEGSSFCCDGPQSQMLKSIKSKRRDDAWLVLQAPPCCCWPFCGRLLPERPLKVCHITNLGYLVLQMPFTTSVVYFVLLVMASEHQRIYNTYYQFLQPICLASILLGIYGINVTLKLASAVLPERPLQNRFRCLQLVLISTKLQALLIRLLASNGVVPCMSPLAPALVANLIQNSLVLCEMLLLAVWARFIYRNPVSKQDENTPINIAVSARSDNNNAVLANPQIARSWTGSKDNAFVIENQYGDMTSPVKHASRSTRDNTRSDVHITYNGGAPQTR
ncbi:organic solute transporter alpha-like protein, partial [Ctenocephalides felis]|uniref:organic solute transporter alpha-like protein n=1 Tax=Ctenocephalides felis TaxID=7515 RepID=UPI000E6E23E2